jgi:hypothetical protein
VRSYGPNIRYHTPTQRQYSPAGRNYAPTGPVAGGKAPLKPPTSSVRAPRGSREYPDRFFRDGITEPATRGASFDYQPPRFGAGGGNAIVPVRVPKRDADTEAGIEDSQRLETLEEALEDITTAWKKSDPAGLQSRFPKDGAVNVFDAGKFSYRVLGSELSRQVGEGVRHFKTVAFDLEKPTPLESNRYFVSGKHTFAGEDQAYRQMYVSYVLERAKDQWRIVEYGFSTTPVKRHQPITAREEEFGPDGAR